MDDQKSKLEKLEHAVAEAKAKYLKAADKRRFDSAKLFNDYSILLLRYRLAKRGINYN